MWGKSRRSEPLRWHFNKNHSWGFDTLGCDSNASTRLHLPAKGWAHAFHTDGDGREREKRKALSCLAADPTLEMKLQISMKGQYCSGAFRQVQERQMQPRSKPNDGGSDKAVKEAPMAY